jgi:long-chain acyl-CoA synthetase
VGLNLSVLVSDSARRAPQAIALRLEDRSLTYQELDEQSDRLAMQLIANGLEPGDRVGLMLPNVPEFAVAYFGVLKAGCVVVPVNVLSRDREVAFLLNDSGARLLITSSAHAETALAGARTAGFQDVVAVGEPVAGTLALPETPAPTGPVMIPRQPGDTAVILYTSGTTGKPKGAQLTHSNLLWNSQVTTELFELGPGDTVLGALPLFHAFGQTCAMNAAMRRASTLQLMPRFDAASALDLIEREAVTVFLGVPTMYIALLNSPNAAERDLSSLRLCVSGGAAIPVEVLHGFQETFGARILEGYGLSETSPVASFNHLDRPSKPGSIGTAVWGTEMRVADGSGRPLSAGEVGEILIRGHHVMSGYWNRPNETAAAIDQAGWFHTGDLARVDEDGYFFIVDRKKDLIIRGGYNVYPREVEEVIYQHPDVAEAAVVAMSHDRLGEEVVAAVVAKPGRNIDPALLRTWLSARLAAYKYPRHVVVLDALPKGPTGKILKREIRLPDAVRAAQT